MLRQKQKRIDEYKRKLDRSKNEQLFIDQETSLIDNINTLITQCRVNANAELGKLPPQATDLEGIVLGGAILENSAFSAVKSFLKPEHFYIEAHRIIWEAALIVGKDQNMRIEKDKDGYPVKVYDNPIDFRSIYEYLRKTGKAGEVGGAEYLMTLTAKVSSTANTEMHARVLIEYAIKRELILMAGEIMYAAYEETSDCFDVLDTADSKVKTIQAWIK